MVRLFLEQTSNANGYAKGLTESALEFILEGRGICESRGRTEDAPISLTREVLIEVGEDVAVGGVLIKALSALKVPAAIAMGHATGEFITAGGQQTEENVRELNKLIGDPKLVAKLSSQAAYPAALAESMVAYGFAKVPISQRPGLRQILGITRETGSGGIEEGVNIYINNLS